MADFDLPVIPRKAAHESDASLLLEAADRIEQFRDIGDARITSAVAELIRRAVRSSDPDLDSFLGAFGRD